MKGLTLTQPWATLVAIGAKRIETRSWHTSYRGPLAIHAAKGYPDRGLRFDEPFFMALWRAGIRPDMPIPTGAIVAVCTLLDCVPTHNPAVAVEPGKPWFTGARRGVGQHYYEVPPTDSNEYAFGDYTPGRYAWLLADVCALPEPIPCKGALSLWEPDTKLQAAIKRQLIAGRGWRR